MRATEPRIAIAYDCFFPLQTGGGERVYRRMAELLVERGAHVTYVTRSEWETDAAPPAPFDLHGVWRGEIYDANGTRTTSSAVAFAFALFSHFVRRRDAYDAVVVAALPVLNVFAVRLALLGSGTRLVVDWLEVWSARKWRAYGGVLTGTIAWLLQSLAIRIGDVATVNSGFTRNRLRVYRPRAQPIVLGLVDLVGSEPEASVVPSAPPILLFVGRHIPDKRLDALPGALAHARREIPELVAQIAGRGPETQRVRAAAAAAGVAHAIEFVGRIDDDDLRRRYRAAAALVNPSAREGFGLVVAEAAAAATPSVVVAGDDNAAAELVEPGVNGAIAVDASAATLGDAIVRVVNAGKPLRASTLAWFERERVERGLARSVDELLRRLGY
ncbi:glycosyltransferase family 4 protein [Microbacterium sp. QXD-8]|uniref:D-inositol 3-phosphate glycosyltransferase n=1 Tax=Microbacterium psychrotolerans TaxID=3068321 RepID=A0ABU0Z2H7_9MICO|nr:glycosyltransferase family 4 protein [Microbacterium sp. QXD-8]MDQ7878784.1 glycosyltransferase family 4 protein [Microbacterium sp. QXD-8]